MELHDAVAEVVFGSETTAKPVYCFADEVGLARIIQLVGVDGEDAREVFVGLVRHQLNLHGTSDLLALSKVLYSIDSGTEVSNQVPKYLPLLLVLVLAADLMHADGSMAAHNYYGRLHELLGTPEGNRDRLEREYRSVAVELWDGLNAWLEAWEGDRGIPTAYSIGPHAFVGLPMSQSVLRVRDREGLHDLFYGESLRPGTVVAPTEMASIIEPYIGSSASPLSKNLQRLWLHSAAKERIVDASCLELQTWDGSLNGHAAFTGRASNSQLMLSKVAFPKKRLGVNLLLPRVEGEVDQAALLIPSSSGEMRITLRHLSGTQSCFASEREVDPHSLLENRIVAQLADTDGAEIRHSPRSVVPMIWDSFLSSFVEVDQVILGQPNLILVREKLLQRVFDLLNEVARPGWAIIEDSFGKIDGWQVIENVEIFGVPLAAPHADLLPLCPRARVGLSIVGGMKLPGSMRKWSALDAPEIVGIVPGSGTFEVRLYRGTRVQADAEQLRRTASGGPLIVDLKDLGLEDGEYLVCLFLEGEDAPTSSTILRLRTANTPEFKVELSDIHLVYSPQESPLWPVSAGPADWPNFINGVRIEGADFPNGLAGTPIITIPQFDPAMREKVTSNWRIVKLGTETGPNSCFHTGMHHFDLPTQKPGDPVVPTVEGICRSCGMVKRSAGNAKAATTRTSLQAKPFPAERFTNSFLPNVSLTKSGSQVVFDAICHLGQGTFDAFQQIASNASDEKWYAHELLGQYEAIGAVDVSRDTNSRVAEWAVNSPTIFPTHSGDWLLVGAYSSNLLGRISDALGQDFFIDEQIDTVVPRVSILGSVENLQERSVELQALGVKLLLHPPADALAAALPKLSVLADGLPRLRRPSFGILEKWDTKTLSWTPVDHDFAVGAYRSRDFGYFYFLKSETDIESETIAPSFAQLVKYVAHMWAGVPLMSYDSLRGSVRVPLGAPAPGLWGRALTLTSGMPPSQSIMQGYLDYQSVSEALASKIFTSLMS